MYKPLVSIITPSYNQAQFIEETIRSVLDQDYENIEFIIIDGGSSDSTSGILKKYERDITRLIIEPDQGQSDAINKGWRLATGEIVAWLNSDDLYLHGTVRKVVDILTQYEDIGMLFGNAVEIDKHGTKLGIAIPVRGNKPKVFLSGSSIPYQIPQPSVFIRRSILNQTGLLDEALNYAMDFDLYMRIIRNTNVLYIPQVLASMRLYIGTKSTRNNVQNLREKLFVLRRYERDWFTSRLMIRYLRFRIFNNLPSSMQNYLRMRRGLPRDQVFINQSK